MSAGEREVITLVTSTLEGWADMVPADAESWRRYTAPIDRRWPRAQHYFLGGRSLCGKRYLEETGFIPPAIFTLERNPRHHTPGCAKCDKRASSYLFRRRRTSRLGKANVPERDRLGW